MTVSAGTRAKLHERAMGCCERCGKPGATNAHHRLNQSQGGPDTLSNLLLMCGSGTTGCHGWVTQHPDDAQAHGFTVKLGQLTLSRTEPVTVSTEPVRRWSRVLGRAEWVLLDDDGGITPNMLEQT